MGEPVKSKWLSDSGTNAPLYTITIGTTTDFNTLPAPGVGVGLLMVARELVRGDWSIYYETSGGGTVNFEYFLSWDGTTAIDTSSSQTIIAGVTTGTVEASGFAPVLAPWLGIRATETGVGTVNFDKLVLTYH